MTRSPFRKSYLDLLPAYKPYAFEFFLDRPSTKRCCTAALGQTPSLEHWSTIVQPSSRMSLLSPFLELSISSRMYRHFSRFDSFGWHFTLKVPPQQIILAQCVFLWDQSCSLMIQVRYFSGLSIVNLIFLLYCASNDICVCNIVCMWLYWALPDMESYFWVHLLLWRGTWRRSLWNSFYSSPGDSSMHVRAFIMLLLWSKKEYGLLKSNLWRLGLRGFFK